ncbi:hypothetical protein TIFTF001_002311 [Ficus carica]|uniref:Uncharacterized protein n=1 Tax=Ficus carica TaxID=3494 RepID=A0AA87Z5E1_FICCA|nr:hypothetical protein TIFTF001_002311 [Ficus carica]
MRSRSTATATTAAPPREELSEKKPSQVNRRKKQLGEMAVAGKTDSSMATATSPTVEERQHDYQIQFPAKGERRLVDQRLRVLCDGNGGLRSFAMEMVARGPF